MTKSKTRNEKGRSDRETLPAPPPAHLIASTRVHRKAKRHGNTEESGLLKIIREVLATVA